MKNNSRFYKIGFQPGLIALVFIVPILACSSSPVLPFAGNPTDPSPGLISTVAQDKLTQENVLPSSLVATSPPASAFALKTSVATTTPLVNTVPNPFPLETPSEDVVWEMLGKVSADRALNDLKQLTGDKPICTNNGCFTIKQRVTGSEGLKWAKDYVAEELAVLGYSVMLQEWSTSKWSDQDIIARKPGILHPEEEIYFVAHLDGSGTTGDIGFPGADDNASGVVDILELARVLHDYSFNRTVVLLISTGEEQGTLGVQSYLNHLSASELGSIKYVVNIDMIGYDANQDTVMELWHGGHTPSLEFVNQISNIIETYQINLLPTYVVGCG